jgi:hypothetical protein
MASREITMRLFAPLDSIRELYLDVLAEFSLHELTLGSHLDNRSTPYIGKDGVTLAEVWDPDPVAYFSVNPEKMPNLFLMFGPNSAPFAGSIVHVFEAAAGYIIKCIQKMQREYIKSMVVK